MKRGGDFSQHWLLDPAITFLNHGSFGACPRAVLESQRSWQERIEQEPVRFLHREIEQHLDQARARLAQFVGAPAQDLVFVHNATSGVNSVLRSLSFEPGEELLTTDHEYRASRNALDFVAERCGARVVIAEIPFPLKHEDEVVSAILGKVTTRTRLLLVDHVTSPTALVLPIERIVQEMTARGIDTLVDGAHAPGMLPLDLKEIGAAYYTGNCHKWVCTPKGAALLYVRADRQEGIRPLAISHGATAFKQRSDRSRFQVEFDWQGTVDPSAWLTVPAAIDFMAQLLLGGWHELRERNRMLALRARTHLCEALGIAPACPDSMIGSLATVLLPDSPLTPKPAAPLFLEPLQVALFEQHCIEVPVMSFPGPPRRCLRISAQIYNEFSQYQALARALGDELSKEKKGKRRTQGPPVEKTE